jgi:hypothetical protein
MRFLGSVVEPAHPVPQNATCLEQQAHESETEQVGCLSDIQYRAATRSHLPELMYHKNK